MRDPDEPICRNDGSPCFLFTPVRASFCRSAFCAAGSAAVFFSAVVPLSTSSTSSGGQGEVSPLLFSFFFSFRFSFFGLRLTACAARGLSDSRAISSAL